MQLKILLPSRVFAVLDDVAGIVAETEDGCIGLLPQRLDCVAALVPGILIYRVLAGDRYLAVDAGVLVKIGPHVLVSVRHAIPGSDLTALHDNVKRDFLAFDEEERVVRRAVALLVGSFVSRFEGIGHA